MNLPHKKEKFSIKSRNSVIKLTWWAHGGTFKNLHSSPLFTILIRPEMLKFHPYSTLTGETRVEFDIYRVLKKDCCQIQDLSKYIVRLRQRMKYLLMVHSFLVHLFSSSGLPASRGWLVPIVISCNCQLPSYINVYSFHPKNIIVKMHH